MKKASFLFLAVLFISSGSLFAQGFHLGVKGGVNMSQLQGGESFSNGFKLGLSGGAFAELNFNKHIGLQPELLFNQTNTRTATNFDQIYQLSGYSGRDVYMNYLSIPVLLSIRPIPLISILVGPQFGIKLSDNIGTSALNAFKSGDFSVVGGAQLNLGGFKVGARYIVGLNNLNDINDNYKWQAQTIQLYVGFRII
ncbi:MAG: porin family protein [Bacteroidota bacterium]|nr:porin family protein [Bacteroidota bacterium]MDP4213735.1 porin family protein [Bacteroidota bacterium]MDP4248487.1 porin family protein [Bacteroidota bacterium]